jgi:hypothetical protein
VTKIVDGEGKTINWGKYVSSAMVLCRTTRAHSSGAA